MKMKRGVRIGELFCFIAIIASAVVLAQPQLSTHQAGAHLEYKFTQIVEINSTPIHVTGTAKSDVKGEIRMTGGDASFKAWKVVSSMVLCGMISLFSH
jgi:hypothetical protein